MATVNPYLNFPGTTEDAFNFYKSVFGVEFITIQRFRDTPEADRVPPHLLDKIMHVAMPLGKGNILMATDALEEMGHKVTSGTNFFLSITADSKPEADQLFNALGDGGSISVPLADMFWGAYFGILTDKFGIQWMINYDYNQN